MYSVMAIIGLLACGIIGYFLAKRRAVSFEDMMLIMLVAAGGILVGGHLLYGVTQTKTLVAAVKAFDKIGFGGFVKVVISCFGGSVFYGGFIGATIAVYLFSGKIKSLERSAAMDMFAVCVPLFHAFGRIGCFLGGCCYGVESSFGFIVHGNTVVPEINDVRRLPVSLFESGANFLIFFLLLTLFNKRFREGKLIYVYMLVYAPVRFVLEFFRGDEIRGIFLGLSTSQWISLALVLFVAVRAMVKHGQRRAGQDG